MHFLLLLVYLIVPELAPEDGSPKVLEELKRVMLKMEIVGPEEKWIDLRSECRYCGTYASQLQSAPTLADLELLPLQHEIQQSLFLNRAFLHDLEVRARVGSKEKHKLAELIRYVGGVGAVWREMETAANPANSWVDTRRAMMNVRNMIGFQNFYRRTWPCPMPLHTFSER